MERVAERDCIARISIGGWLPLNGKSIARMAVVQQERGCFAKEACDLRDRYKHFDCQDTVRILNDARS